MLSGGTGEAERISQNGDCEHLQGPDKQHVSEPSSKSLRIQTREQDKQNTSN